MVIQINFVDAHKEEIRNFIKEANRCWTRKKLYYKIIPFAKQFFIWGYVSGIFRLGSQKMIDRLDSSPSPAKPDSLTKESKPIGTDGSPNGSETGGGLNSEVK
jgi:hypothetical protein